MEDRKCETYWTLPRKLGYKVTEHVGKYEDVSQGFGVVAVMQKGSASPIQSGGKTVMSFEMEAREEELTIT